MRVRRMPIGMRWGATLDGKSPAHIMKAAVGTGDAFERTKCGVYVLVWQRGSLLHVPVCQRCLKARGVIGLRPGVWA